MNSINQDYIIDYVGAENWEMVIEMFTGKNQVEIETELNQMFPADDNVYLAKKISQELS